jgi:predicted metal-binding protein
VSKKERVSNIKSEKAGKVKNGKREVSKNKNLEKNLQSIISLLKEQGASDVVLINTADIVVDERVRLKCRVPVCDSYNKNLMCPPYVPPVAEFQKTLKKYEQGILLQVSAELNEKYASAPTEEVFLPARKLHELVNAGEKEAFTAGFRFAAGFIGGCCRLCDECVAVHGGMHCRFPFKARPSMEAMGIDVMATVEKADLSVSFPISNRVTWTGLILL